MNDQLEIFLEIARALNAKGVVPTLYGSLGLQRWIKEVGKINDIDIIIPATLVTDRFDELKIIIEELGYKQDLVFPHEFTKGNGRIGFEPEGELHEYAKVDSANFKETDVDGVKFKELRPEDYLAVYKKTAEDREEKLEKDKRKIKALEELLM